MGEMAILETCKYSSEDELKLLRDGELQVIPNKSNSTIYVRDMILISGELEAYKDRFIVEGREHLYEELEYVHLVQDDCYYIGLIYNLKNIDTPPVEYYYTGNPIFRELVNDFILQLMSNYQKYAGAVETYEVIKEAVVTYDKYFEIVVGYHVVSNYGRKLVITLDEANELKVLGKLQIGVRSNLFNQVHGNFLDVTKASILNKTLIELTPSTLMQIQRSGFATANWNIMLLDDLVL